ncbi:MAG: hypothetical protein J6W35_00675 [Eubacterium sp.]|nr:hypothetical protein [Eubacterium sp.]
MKWFEDIFTKSKLMIVSGILGIVCFVFLAFNALYPFFEGFVNYAIVAALTIALMVCYKKGETSAQKALAGAVLAAITFWYWQISAGIFGRGSFIIDVLEFVLTVTMTVILINHIILQIDHKGDTIVIYINQVVLIVAILVQLAEFILQIISKDNMYYDKIHSLGVLAIVTMITCMESKIQKYKARRFKAMSAGTWTEEERKKSKKIFKF